MDFDDLLKNYLGEFGKGQRIIVFIVFLAGFPPVFHTMGIMFLAGVPEHRCAVPELDSLNISSELLKNISIPVEEKDGQAVYSSCNMFDQNFTGWTAEYITEVLSQGEQANWSTVACRNGWVYDRSTYLSTLVTEWDLVCNRIWLNATIKSVYFAGMLVGVVIFGALSDLLGRKRALCIGLILQLISAISAAFSPTALAFCVLRFFVAVFTVSFYSTVMVIGMEIVGQSYRVHAGVIIGYYWAVGYMTVAGVAYWIRDWFHLQIAFSLTSTPMLVYMFFIPESPRWLYTQNKSEKADKIIQKIAQINRAKLPDNMQVTIKNTKKGFIWDLVRTPRLRVRSIIIFFTWFANSMVYNGLSLNSSSLGGNEYLNFFITGAVEIPAYATAHVTLPHFGRRWPLCMTMILGGVALICTIAIPPELNWVLIALAMVGKFAITAAFSIVYVFTAELYPTVLRTTGLGTSSVFARIGSISATYILLLSTVSKFIPLITFGAFSVIFGLLSLRLPETKGKKLPETIEDGEKFGRKQKNILVDGYLEVDTLPRDTKTTAL